MHTSVDRIALSLQRIGAEGKIAGKIQNASCKIHLVFSRWSLVFGV